MKTIRVSARGGLMHYYIIQENFYFLMKALVLSKEDVRSGRCEICTYNPKKPHKLGIKLYKVCDSENRYCCNFKIEVGESTNMY